LVGAGFGLILITIFRLIGLEFFDGRANLIFRISLIILFAIIFFITGPKIFKGFESLQDFLEEELKGKSLPELLWGLSGLIIGLLVAFFISQPIYRIPIPYLGSVLSILVYVMFGFLGVRLAVHNKEELTNRIKEALQKPFEKKETLKLPKISGRPKVLDTSVIIDGRIKDICDSGFLEGPVIVPVFVLEELQHIADSADNLKRTRGRRGLDIIHEMQEDKVIEIIVSDLTYDDIAEVDSKLLKLTKDVKGKIVTNDYNLNKVAKVQNIEVLNINELANSVKPVYLPGEEMSVSIVKVGKELNQGLSYLDDGTMIVVENGKDYLGKSIKVEVTSVLQTSAGKMIFAKPKAA
jgi:hypothetical protein